MSDIKIQKREFAEFFGAVLIQYRAWLHTREIWQKCRFNSGFLAGLIGAKAISRHCYPIKTRVVTDMPLIIRLAREADVRILDDLFLKFSDWHLEREKSIQKAIRDPNGLLLVAELDGEVVAFLHEVFFNDPLHAGLNSDITSLFVKEEHRRKGIASQLLGEALEAARKRNVIEVHVTTRENNNVAVILYEGHGFERAGVVFEKNP